MDCMEVRERLPFYQDGDLSKARIDAVDEHLKSCDECRKAYADLAAAWDVMDAWEDAAPPDSLRKRVFDSLPLRGSSSRRVALSVAAGLLLVIGAALYYAATGTGKTGNIAERDLMQRTDEHVRTNEDEIVANLQILDEEEFFDALDEMVKIDYLPLMDETDGQEQGRQRSSLDGALT